MWQSFLGLDVSVQAAIISAVVGLLAGIIGTCLTFFFGRISLRDKLQMEYEYSERKKLRALIGKYQGSILESSEQLNHRLWNLHINEKERWLDVDGNYSLPDSNYYFTSTVYRTLYLYCLIRQFEKEAIFIDSRIAKDGELVFLKFTKALVWVLTDVNLFNGINYDYFRQTDHIFTDKLKLLCDSCIVDEKVIGIEEFHILLEEDNYLRVEPLLLFFDGLCSSENRLRWDRIISLHLILMSFINWAGYKVQYSSKKQFLEIADTYNNDQVLSNLMSWLPKLDLTRETKLISFVSKTSNKKSTNHVFSRLFTNFR